MNSLQEHDELCPPPSADDDDLTLPRASINKMIKELVSGNKSNTHLFSHQLQLMQFNGFNISVYVFLFGSCIEGAIDTCGQRKS